MEYTISDIFWTVTIVNRKCPQVDWRPWEFRQVLLMADQLCPTSCVLLSTGLASCFLAWINEKEGKIKLSDATVQCPTHFSDESRMLLDCSPKGKTFIHLQFMSVTFVSTIALCFESGPEEVRLQQVLCNCFPASHISKKSISIIIEVFRGLSSRFSWAYWRETIWAWWMWWLSWKRVAGSFRISMMSANYMKWRRFNQLHGKAAVIQPTWWS